VSLQDIDQYNAKRALLQSVETERQRIARDLHDSTTQNLTALVHKTELCTKLLDVDPVRCKLELYNVGTSLRKIIEDMRGLIYDLRPMSFDDMGFRVTVERFLDKFHTLHNIACSYQEKGEPYSFDSVVQISLLRVIQEACSNTAKHANASKITITLTYHEKSIVLEIVDDGDGFDANEIPDTIKSDNSGFGLSMMRERIYLLSGKISLESSPGEGCSIIVTIPKSGSFT
jgi:two-component system sensor histidine kinase DegS